MPVLLILFVIVLMVAPMLVFAAPLIIYVVPFVLVGLLVNYLRQDGHHGHSHG